MDPLNKMLHYNVQNYGSNYWRHSFPIQIIQVLFPVQMNLFLLWIHVIPAILRRTFRNL